MAKFEIFAGLSGGFGGAQSHGIYEYENEAEAVKDAYQLAVEDYESYGGSHGLMDWDMCKEDLIESFGEDVTDEDVSMHYQEEMESWLSYYAVEIH